MHIVKRSIGLLVVALSLCAVAATAASAALPEFLDNVAGNTYTVKSGKGSLKAGAFTIEAKTDTGSGEVTGAKTITATVNFESATLLGLAANSLGDAAKTILVKATGTLCYISKAEKTVGVLFTITPVHIEVPSVGELVEVSGTALGDVEKVNSLSTSNVVTLNEKTSKQKCEGGEKVELKAEKEHNKKPEAGLETTTEELTFTKDIEVDA